MDVAQVLSALVDLWLPAHCPGCAAMLPPGVVACAACDASTLRVADVPHCPACQDLAGPSTCQRCAREPAPFHRVETAFVFGAAVQDAVHRLKFGDSPWVAAPLWRWAWTTPPSPLGGADGVVPLPLHAARHRERGYDQARLLAQAASRDSGVPVLRALKRVRTTRAVAELAPAQRDAEMKDAFAMRDGVNVRGLRLVLVDDVVTTTASVRAAAGVLRAAGAARVDVVGIARAGDLPD